MKLKNPTKKLISVALPITVGKYNRPASKWYHVEPNAIVDMLDEHAWRGEAHGLTKDLDTVISDVGDDFSILNGIADELKDVLKDKYTSLENMNKVAKLSELVAISGIGQKRAIDILEQLKNLYKTE